MTWDEARLGEVLAAIGNHEAKALVFLAMEDDEAYGVTAIHRRFLEIQGSPPAVPGGISTAQKYLVHSFLPIGLVAREQLSNGWIHHIKEDSDGVATALAGFLLASTLEGEIALSQLFGKTSVSSAGSERSPIRRYRIMRALADAPDQTYPTAIADVARVRDTTTGLALGTFAQFGLLRFETDPTYELRTAYRVTEPLPPLRGRGRTSTQTVIGEYLNRRWADAPGGELAITRDEIEQYLRTLPHWQDIESLRDVVQGIMKRLDTRGVVTAVSSHYGATHARVEITAEQRAYFDHLASGITAIAAGRPDALAAGQCDAERIVNDTVAVRRLMRRAFAASKLASNPMTEGEKLRVVADALAANPGATTEDLMAGLDPKRMNAALLRQSLSELRRRGEAVGVKQPDGPYKRWYPV